MFDDSHFKLYFCGAALSVVSCLLWTVVNAIFEQVEDFGVSALALTFYRGCWQLAIVFISDVILAHILFSRNITDIGTHKNLNGNEMLPLKVPADIDHDVEDKNNSYIVEPELKVHYEIEKIFKYYSFKNTTYYGLIG